MLNVYDFDGTIFDGDSTARFCRFAVRRHPSLLLGLPRIGWHFMRYALHLECKTDAKQAMYQFLLQHMKDTDATIQAFWAENGKRIKDWYLAQKDPSDVIISASPDFLLAPICQTLGVRLLASRVNPVTGDYIGVNCDGQEKVRRFRDFLPPTPYHFYSDARIDSPMANLAEKAFLVSGNTLSPWPWEKDKQ